MDASSIFHTLRPSVTSLGYALFLAINAAGVWGGVFPFLPLEFQTHEIVFWFFLAQSLAFSFSYLASAAGVYLWPGPTRSFLVKLASLPYAAGWVCLIAAIYLDQLSLTLATIGGGLLGLGSAGFYMLWQRLFASTDSDTGTRELVKGSAYAAILYFSLYLIPRAVTAFLIPLVFLPLFGLCITLKSREISLDQPMFEDVPREHPHVYRRILHDYWRSALSVGTIGFCAGIMRSLAVADVQVGSLVNIMSMGGMFAAALILLFAWHFRTISLNVISIYRVVFPFLITSFLLLPLAPAGYQRWLAAILYAVYSAAIMLMMAQCAQISRDRGVNPVFVYGFFGTIVYTLHDVGFVGGTFAEGIRVMGITPLAMVALVAVYLLGLMHFLGSGGFGPALGRKAGEIEFAALVTTPTGGVVTAENDENDGDDGGAANPAKDSTGLKHGSFNNPASEPASPQSYAEVYPDRLSAQVQALREHYRLTARETEITELIARGNTVARIAEMLFVSENTVRTHSKRIYAKLDIHKKQELIDLMESF